MLTITEAKHKLVIYNFFIENGREKQFPLSKLMAAVSLSEKIMNDAEKEEKEVNGQKGIDFTWGDSPIELTLSEIIFVKEEVGSIKVAIPSLYPFIESLKELLEDKSTETPEKGTDEPEGESK